MEVEGIILILSCEKHKNTRLINYGPLKNDYDGWKVVKIIGDLFLDCNYKVKKETFQLDNGVTIEEELLYIKCEDSYLHLLKKLALSIKYIREIYKIKQGILRCGDDLIFNEELLQTFLKERKYDFYGKSHNASNYTNTDVNVLKKIRLDPFMLQYYMSHQDELHAKKHGIHLTVEELKKYLWRPDVVGPAGIIYYISNRACEILINTMEQIDYNIFHYDEFTKSYPYIIEDCGMTYIMYYNKIPFIDNQIFWAGKWDKCPLKFITMHTNVYK